ncbi:MAG: sulfite exporter TauE/SafE family protein [Polyangiaceae bacterium]
MNLSRILPIVAASLLGSAHCAGMCGGFVLAYSGADRDGPGRRGHVAYHLGRLLSYATLGALAGALGRAINLAGAAAGFATAAAIVAGSLMMAFGLAALLETQGVRLPKWRLSGLAAASGRVLARFRARSTRVRSFVLGACSALLPCGWLYAFAVSAAGTASPLWGAVVMVAFWSGTVPALLGMGMLAARWAAIAASAAVR